MKYARKRDANEREIVQALEAVGAAVQKLNEAGCPDLLVSFRNELHLVEVKDSDGGVGTRAAHRRNKLPGPMAALTPAQVEWWAHWRGKPPVIVTNAAEALAAIGAEVRDA